MILCGVRDIRDYRIHTQHNEIITGGSAFNIKAKSLTLENFTLDQCRALYLQHTTATGQVFEDAIYDKLWRDTKGQPWLVNALAFELTWENKALRNDRTQVVTLNHYQEAREELIYSRATHLDQLVDKLQEDRVRRVIAPLLSNSSSRDTDFSDADLEYVSDLGLITRKPSVAISNDIYKEVIPRELTIAKQQSIANQDQEWYIKDDSSIDVQKLLTAFQQFFRENADSWIERFDYKKAGPQLLLQAFLQRLINGGGRINREYGLGRKRTDIFVEWPMDKERGFFGERIQKVVIETKIFYSNLEATILKGCEQTTEYADIVGADECHLIIFNRDKKLDWDSKIWHQQHEFKGCMIDVWGC